MKRKSTVDCYNIGFVRKGKTLKFRFVHRLSDGEHPEWRTGSPRKVRALLKELLNC